MHNVPHVRKLLCICHVVRLSTRPFNQQHVAIFLSEHGARVDAVLRSNRVYTSP